MSKRWMATTVLAGALALVTAACGGGDDGGEEATCTPSGTALSVSAQNTQFSTGCLAAPAGETFTVEFENLDADSHNVSIHEGDEHLFVGEIIEGPATVTYEVPALAAGTYEFMCDVHPQQMTGTFVVA